MRLNFSTNWNGKLDCKSFTTFRLQSSKYRVGSVHDVYLKKEMIGTAKVLAIRDMPLRSVNEFIARIDTGCSLEDFRGIIRKMYKNADRELFSLVLLEWQKKMATD